MIGRTAYLRAASSLVGALAAVILAACAGPAEPHAQPPASSLVDGSSEPVPVPVPETTPQPASDKSTRPSPSKRPAPVKSSATPSPSPVKTLDYYLARLPKFGPAPDPEPIDAGAGDSSPVWLKVPTTQPVAFLTIDDGMVQHPMALPLLKASGVRVTLFLTLNYAQKNPAYFKALQDAGAVIENHTITHTSLKGKSYDFQKHEICYTADRFTELFGRRPTLFRPPYGDYDATTLQVARECGQKVVFYWTETVDKGIVRYQTSNHSIQPGHIVLMHFRPAYGDDFTAALIRMKASGVRPALLEDYVQGACENSCRP